MIPDVAIIGAGVIGASCAFHFARAGFSVRVFDRAPAPGGGSTSRATGGFRAQFATAMNVRLSILAREQLRRFSDDTGVDPGFAPVGYLWLATSEAELAELRAANALQIREGLSEARIVARDDILAINPHISRDGVVGGAWCASDGTLRPMEILRGYLDAAVRLGADIHWGETVTGFDRARDRITHVRTSSGSHAAGLIVNAAGPWAASIAQLAGVALPVEPLRRQVALTEPMPLPASMPLTIWLADGFHVRVRDDRALLLLPTPGDPADPYSDRVDPAWLDAIAHLAPARIPALRDIALDRTRAWAGLYEVSPDRHAILGFAGNLLFVNGSSGHGVMHAPALGLLASELAAGTAPTLDVHALRPSRFADGDPIRGSSLL